MVTSSYIRPYDNTAQQTLYKQLIDQCIRLWGIDCLYIPRTTQAQQLDLLFGEDTLKTFTGGYPIAVMIQNVDSFEGSNLFSKFGFIINKTVRVIMGDTAFTEAMVSNSDIGSRPREGDLVWLRPFSALYEIKFVQQDKFFYAFGNQKFYGYELEMEEFRYNNEIIQTGVDEVDAKVAENMFAYQAVMGAGTLSFALQETVYQGANLALSTANATVLSWNKPLGLLVLTGIAGKFRANVNVIGVISGASYVLESIETEENTNESLDNNIIVRDAANSFLDISETNSIQGNPITQQSQE